MPEPTQLDPLALHDEQVRLRTELDQLRAQYEKLQQESAKPGKDGKEEKKEGEDGKKDEEKKDGKKEDNKKEEKKDDKPKEPLFTRARKWIAAHPLTVILSLVGLAVLLIGGYFLLQYLSSFENTDDAQVDGHTDPISSRITGDVVGVYIQNTQRIRKGEVVVDLDPRDYEVALAQARANLAQAVANLQAQSPNVPITTTTQNTQVKTAALEVASAEASLRNAQQSLLAAAADTQEAEANAENAVREQERYGLLVGKQEVSREQYDQRVTAARAQKALVASRRSSEEAAAKVVEQRRAVLDQAAERYEEAKINLPRNVAVQHATEETRQAAVKAAKAQVDQALLNMTYCKIYAPEDGIVGDKSVEVGEHVAPGQEMFALTQTNDIWVTANFKETQIRNMHPRQSVSITVDALSQTFDGYIEELPGATGATYSLLPPENATGNYVKVVQRLPVRIRFKPDQPHAERLRPGMSVEPKVWINTQ